MIGFNYDGTLGIDKEKYRLLFLFGNCFGIFKEEVQGNKIEYCTKEIFSHDCTNPEDLLIDILLKVRADNLQLENNDLIYLRINGGSLCYRVNLSVGWSLSAPERIFRNLPDFLEEEKTQLLRSIHRNDQVLDLLNGKTCKISEIDITKVKVCAIDSESSKYKNNMANGFMTYYSILELVDGKVKLANPFVSPFQSLQNALYYYKHKNVDSKQDRLSLLVYNRAELEMIADYYELQQLMG